MCHPPRSSNFPRSGESPSSALCRVPGQDPATGSLAPRAAWGRRPWGRPCTFREPSRHPRGRRGGGGAPRAPQHQPLGGPPARGCASDEPVPAANSPPQGEFRSERRGDPTLLRLAYGQPLPPPPARARFGVWKRHVRQDVQRHRDNAEPHSGEIKYSPAPSRVCR